MKFLLVGRLHGVSLVESGLKHSRRVPPSRTRFGGAARRLGVRAAHTGGTVSRTACGAVITAPQVGASCLGISLGPPPARVIARRARLRCSSAQIFAARASVDRQRRVYAPGVTSPLSYARTTACTRSRSPSLASRLETWVLI